MTTEGFGATMNGGQESRNRKPIRSFKDLIVWQKAMDLVDLVYEITRGFPAEERFGLALQMRKAVVSIPSNIAEGYGRRRKAEYQRFLDISRGSLHELMTQTVVSQRQGYVPGKRGEEMDRLMDEVGRMLYRLVERLDDVAPLTKRPG